MTVFKIFKNISIYITIFLFLTQFLFVNRAFAQTTDYAKMIKVTPVILNIDLEKGQEQSYNIVLTNLLSQPLGVSLNPESLDASDELTGMVFNQPHSNSPFISWITLSYKEIIIPEEGSKEIKVSIKVPKNAKDGSYNSVLFITPFVSKSIDKTSPTVVSRIGILILANIGLPKKSPDINVLKILNFDFQSQNNKTKAILRAQNNFNFNIATKATIEISPFFAQKQTIELDDKRILAGKVRRWEILLNLKPGIYFAKAAVSIGEGKFAYKNSAFTVPAFSSFILWLILIIVIILLILLRKRLKRALFILYKGS